MLRTEEILSTLEMLLAEHLDVRAVTLAVNKGAPVVRETPKAPAAKVLMKLSKTIASELSSGLERKVAQSVSA